MKPYLLAETNWKALKETSIELAVLPWGATEAHNLHLPFSTDNIETGRIAEEAAEKAWKEGAKIIVLPVIPFGVNTGQLDIKGTINLNPSTQFAILKDIIYDLNRQGIHRLLILNGHGGNDFKQMIRESGTLYPEMIICTCNWFQCGDISQIYEKGGGHDDEMKTIQMQYLTSLMQYLAPELVLPLAEAGVGTAKKFRIKALNEKWAWSERKWLKVSKDTGIGDPSLANPEKGERYFKAVVAKISGLMLELSKTDINEMYQ
ncbi:MAG: creatininase family protein [Bacteroidia bacterium]|nr:creatininase family protein [Bacteroidia bacterium]